MLKIFLRDTATYLPSKLLPALTSLISVPILTRLFLPAEYGNWALATGATAFLLALAVSGFAAGVVRFLPAYRVKKELGIFFATLTGALGIVTPVVGAVSFFALFQLREHLPAELYPLLLISILIFMVRAAFIVLMNVMRAQQRSGLYTFFDLLTRYVSLGLGLLLVIVFGLRVEGLLWGTFLAFALALPILVLLSTRGVGIHPRRFQSPDARQLWHYAWPLALGNIAMWALRLSDRYILGIFRSGSEVGLYSVAYSISGRSIDMLVALLLLSMGPIIMNTWESQGRETTEETTAMITRVFIMICLPAAVGLTVLAIPFVDLLTTEAYHEGYRIVGFVAFSSFFWGLSQIASWGTLIRRRTHRIAINQIIAALVNLGLNLVLVPRFGFVAAGFTTLVGFTVLFALQAYTSRSYLAWRFPFRTLRNVVISSICMGALVWMVYGFLGANGGSNLGALLLSIVLAVAAYFGCLWLLGEASKDEVNAIRRIWKRLASRFVWEA